VDYARVFKKHFLAKLVFRWAVSSLGLWIAQGILGSDHLKLGSGSWVTVLLAGLILALVNMAIKPILVIFSFPAIVLSLGLFMLVVNALVIMATSWLYSSLCVKNFGVAILAGIIISIVNLLVTKIIEGL